jgi:hypothetical protein
MTIEFNCPHCNALIAFDDKHCGKQARCFTCGERFIIPSKDNEKAKKIKLPEERGEPLPGFYKMVFVESWKLFTTPENATGMVFIIVAVCFKFFTAGWNFNIHLHIPGNMLSFDIYIPLGYALNIATWGLLFFYYMEIINSTAFDVEKMPEIVLGGFYGMIWRIVKSLYVFFVMLLVVELPYLILLLIMKKNGVEFPVLSYILMLGGLLLFPMAILTAAIGREITMLRPDYLLIPIFRAFRPYLVPAMLLGIAGIIQMHTSHYTHQPKVVAAGYLMLNLVVQFFALFAMRSIGLFYRHYNCIFPW